MKLYELVALAITAAAGPAACVSRDAGDAEAVQPITLERVATLGSAADSISVSGWPTVVEIESGGFLVSGTPFPADRLLHYSSSGTLLGTVGQPGDGPGEFRSVMDLYRTGDSVVVFERTGRMSSVAQDMAVRRVASLPALVQRGWVTPAGEVIAMGRVPDVKDTPLHRFVDGRRVGGFGSIDAVVAADRPSLSQRHAAFGENGTAWLVRPDRYELKEYDAGGTLIRTFQRNAVWFPDRDYELTEPPDPPSPFIIDVAVNEAGHVLVLARVANEPFDATIPRGEGIRATPSHMTEVHDGILEVFDPGSNDVVAAMRSDVPMLRFAAADKVYSVRESDEGVVVVDVWRIRY